MNFSKSLILTSALLSLAAIGSSAVVQIPTTTVFTVSGVFQDNSVLSGTFNLTNGQISSASMYVSGISGVFNVDYGGDYKAPAIWENIELSDNGNYMALSLLIKGGQRNLQNYTGGALCDASSNCGQTVSFYLPAAGCTDPILSKGNISLATAPEPGSTSLLGAGLCAIGFALRRRFAKN